MPLSHPVPPAPARSIHQGEVQTASEQWADRLQEYVDTLLWRLWYPRTSWRTGTGQSVSSTTATASLNLGGDVLTTAPDSYAIGSGPKYTTSQISGKAVLLALNVRRRGPHEPVIEATGWLDGLVVSREPSPLANLPPPPEPVAPATELTPETFVQKAHEAGQYTADLLEWYIRTRWRNEWRNVTRLRNGVVQSVSIPTKRATVLLDPTSQSNAQPTVTCGFGWRAWTAAQLNGKYVRVLEDPILGRYIDDWV